MRPPGAQTKIGRPHRWSGEPHGLLALCRYDPSYQQILGSVSGLLVKAEAFCAEKSLNHDDIIQARLAPDMLPFAYQVKSTAVHSLGAIEGVRRGSFSPDMSPPPETFATLKGRIAETLSALEKIEPAEIDSFIGRDMHFVRGEHRLDFTAENFLLSFSQAEFLLSRHHDLRHTALEGRANRQAGFHRQASPEAVRVHLGHCTQARLSRAESPQWPLPFRYGASGPSINERRSREA